LAACIATPSSTRRKCSTPLRLKAQPRLRFAGQITGCEGYVESAAVGLIAGRMAAAERRGRTLTAPPAETAIGSLINHITGGHIESIDAGPRSFQPMNVNFGLFPPIEPGTQIKPDNFEGRFRGKDKAHAKKRAVTARALRDCRAWLGLGEAQAAAE
jgi:methylenetetrahydrofolate--tRNA-(uracil-5-)-methyltransferase